MKVIQEIWRKSHSAALLELKVPRGFSEPPVSGQFVKHFPWVLSIEHLNHLSVTDCSFYFCIAHLARVVAPWKSQGCRIGNSLTCSDKTIRVQGRWVKCSLLHDLGADGGAIVFGKWGLLFEHDILGGVGRKIESTILDQSEILFASRDQCFANRFVLFF